jgi:hypothetical protein
MVFIYPFAMCAPKLRLALHKPDLCFLRHWFSIGRLGCHPWRKITPDRNHWYKCVP